MKLIILIGPPCSGKTTWAKQHLIGNPEIVRVSKRDITFSLRGAYYVDPAVQRTADTITDISIMSALYNNKNVILDDRNTKVSDIIHYTNSFNSVAELYYKIFDEDIDTLKARSVERYQKFNIPNIVTDIESCCSQLYYLKPSILQSTNLKPLKHTDII